ncbi:MAG: MFS transporter [Proteobacteria bacterium]|nr:MFS transporter [Pseudomonadota bacterium]
MSELSSLVSKPTSGSKPISLDEKKALAIVSTGNFFEYFDMMLFSHLAFVVSPLFMPKTDPVVAKMLTIFTFSSSFLLRPFAAYFWGYIGDHFGRVLVLSYTTLIMAITCFLIPNIPPYAEWGLYSTIALIGCRVLQGFSSAGEAKGAEIFAAEIVPYFPKIFLASVLVPITADLGGMFATLLGSICLSFSQEGWKTCFYIGAAIAVCATVSRRKLRETKDFLDYSKKKNGQPNPLQQFFEKRNFFALMGLNMICPTAFYFAYSFCSDLLKDDIGLSPNMILLSNSSLLLAEIGFLFACARLAYQYDPFDILKVRTLVSFVLIPLAFIALYFYKSHLTVYLAQLIALLSTASFDPATPVVIRSFGIQRRFTQYSKAWAFAKASMYFTTGFLTYYCYRWFDVWGILGLMLFFSGIFFISLFFFVPQNKMAETYLRLKSKGKVPNNEIESLSEDLQPQLMYLKKWVEK